MGEYAKRISDKEDIKIGTCENMYYLRWRDRFKVEPLPGNVNPGEDLNLRFRLPLPQELHLPPGEIVESFETFSRLHDWTIHRDFILHDADAGHIQMKHENGYIFNVACFHGQKLPDIKGFFWNGKNWHLGLAYMKTTAEGLKPIIGCRFCRELFRVEWSDIWDYIDLNLRPEIAKDLIASGIQNIGDKPLLNFI